MVTTELAYNGYNLRYFDKSRYGEVDFVLPARNRVLPLEVKSGEGYRRHKALDNVMAVGEWDLPGAIVLSPGNVEVAGRTCYLPWYLAMFLKPEEEAPPLVSW